ncbi:hypothetical protein ACFQU2_32670 [Siccirubricoccus deserti]
MASLPDKPWFLAVQTVGLFLLGMLAFLGVAALAARVISEHRLAARTDVCADAAGRFLVASTLVDLEREKYLLDAMRCDVGRQLRDLRPAQR